MAVKRNLSLVLFFAVFALVSYARGEDAFASHVHNPMTAVVWEGTTENIERDFGITVPFKTSRFDVHCVRRQFDGARLNLMNVLHEHSSVPLCYAEDLLHGHAHVALYAEQTRPFKEGEHWQKDIAALFLKKLGKDALLDMKQYVSLYMRQFIIRTETARIVNEKVITCSNVWDGIELRQYALLAEVGGAMNTSDISFSISHTMHAVFISFLTPNKDVYMTLVVYNRGVSHDIKNDACALAEQIRH